MPTPTPLIEDRLTNWGDCWRNRLRLDDDQAASIEGVYRSPQRNHWDTDPTVGHAPVVLRELDQADADEVEGAVCAIDLFHHALLKARYIRRMEPIGALKSARGRAGWMTHSYQDKTEAEHELYARMLLARALVQDQLRLPAVVRKSRASDIVRAALGLESLHSTTVRVGFYPQFGSA